MHLLNILNKELDILATEDGRNTPKVSNIFIPLPKPLLEIAVLGTNEAALDIRT
jgi:hypothetical protein